jgi:hypothetical protein
LGVPTDDSFDASLVDHDPERGRPAGSGLEQEAVRLHLDPVGGQHAGPGRGPALDLHRHEASVPLPADLVRSADQAELLGHEVARRGPTIVGRHQEPPRTGPDDSGEGRRTYREENDGDQKQEKGEFQREGHGDHPSAAPPRTAKIAAPTSTAAIHGKGDADDQ